MLTARCAGFTLVELLIGLAIAALLVMLAMPGYSTWVADAQIRNAAESIASGLHYAQAEAIRQNSTVEFTLDPTSGTGGWTADLIDRTTCKPVQTVQTGTFREGANRVNFATLDITGAAGGTQVTFTSLGDRLRDAAGKIANCDASEMLGEVQITSTTGSRQLNVVIFGGASNDPKACPI